MLWIIYECLLNLYQGFLFTWFIHKLLNAKKNEPVAFWCCGLLTSLALSSYIVFPMPSWDSWIFMFPCIYAFVFFKDEVFKKVFWIMILLTIANGTTGVVIHVVSVIFEAPIDLLLSQNAFRIIFTLSVNGLLAIILIGIIKICKRTSSQPHHISALLVSSLICAALTDVFFILKNTYDIPNKWLFIGCGLTLIVGGLTIYIYYVLNDYSSLIQNYQIQEKMLDNQKLQISELQTMYSKMLKLQHDMNAYIKDLKELSETDHAKYLELLNNQLHPVPSTGNPVLDSVLSTKYFKMDAHQIEFRGANLHYTGRMNISDVTLCSLIANMLDNAIEALLQSADRINNPYVYLGFSYSAAGLMIICENPIVIAPSKSHTFLSSKKESGHGLGISIMKKIVEDAGGQIDFIWNSDYFKVLTLIPRAKNNNMEKL